LGSGRSRVCVGVVLRELCCKIDYMAESCQFSSQSYLNALVWVEESNCVGIRVFRRGIASSKGEERGSVTTK
jgi:hypothetical protein